MHQSIQNLVLHLPTNTICAVRNNAFRIPKYNMNTYEDILAR